MSIWQWLKEKSKRLVWRLRKLRVKRERTHVVHIYVWCNSSHQRVIPFQRALLWFHSVPSEKFCFFIGFWLYHKSNIKSMLSKLNSRSNSVRLELCMHLMLCRLFVIFYWWCYCCNACDFFLSIQSFLFVLRLLLLLLLLLFLWLFMQGVRVLVWVCLLPLFHRMQSIPTYQPLVLPTKFLRLLMKLCVCTVHTQIYVCVYVCAYNV